MGIELHESKTAAGIKLDAVRAIVATNVEDGYGLRLEQDDDSGWFNIHVFGYAKEILDTAGGYMLDVGALRDLRDALNQLDLEDD